MSSKRLLAAIMFTDIEGYTSLMQQDENEAILLRERHRNAFEMTIEAFNGKIIQYFGDGTLSIFTSTVEAVDCAIELQKSFFTDPKIPVRIGIHVGDIVYSKNDIIGDAVNIASRIESCAVAGSVLISDKVHDQIRSHRHITTEFLDAYELKNVDGAMPIYAVSNAPLVVPDKKEIKGKFKEGLDVEVKQPKKSYKFTALVLALLLIILFSFTYFRYFKKVDLPSDYSIAVLPFDNLSTDDDAEIFRDGMTEDLLTHLSKLKDLHVISRTSVMQYKNTEKTIPQIAEELGVSYILEGSIRKYGDKVRVTAQLIDAVNDQHLWAENYDKTLTDIFKIQSELSQEIVDAMHLNINFEEQQSLKEIPTTNIEAYKLVLKGKRLADKRTEESLEESLKLYEQAIDLDPNYAEVYAEMANSIYLQTYYSGRDYIEAAKTANEYLDKAVSINDKVSRVYSVKGLIHNIEGKTEKAQEAFEKAIKLTPNDATARNHYATFFYYTRQYEKQLEQAEIAYKLDPLSFAIGNSYFNALAANNMYDKAEDLLRSLEKNNDGNNSFVINRSFFRMYMDQKQYKKAITPLKKMVKKEPVFYRFLAFCYGSLGDTIQAKAIIDSIKVNPNIPEEERTHQLAVAYAGLKQTDSVLYYINHSRNKHSRVLRRERKDFFSFLKDDPRFHALLKEHGIVY